MPYADKSKYVLASEAIPEIARCYFDGDTDKAERDARVAAQDGALRVFSDESIWGGPTPFHQIDKDVWYHNSIDWSGRWRLYIPRADLLKIYPDLWNNAASAPAPEPTIIAGGAKTIGRPTLEDEIAAAYRGLREARQIDFDAPKNKLYGPIRKKVRERKGIPSLQRGLGDEAIRKAIYPLFEADKRARAASP